MKTKEKIRVYVKHTPIKDEQSGKFRIKTSYFVEYTGMLKPVYFRQDVRNVGYCVSLPLDVFTEYFQFEPPTFNKGASSESENDTEQ